MLVWKRMHKLIAVLSSTAVALSLAGCYGEPCTVFYHAKTNLLLSGVETGEPVQAKSIVVKGWAEGIPNSSDYLSAKQLTNSDTNSTDTIIVTHILPKYRIGGDLGVAVNKLLSVGGTLGIGYGYDPLPGSNSDEFRRAAAAGGIWVSVGNRFDSTGQKPRVRFTFRALLSSNDYDSIRSIDTGISDVRKKGLLQLQPNIGLQLPLNRHMAAFTGISVSVGAFSPDSVKFEGLLVHGGLSIMPTKYLSLKPMISCSFVHFAERPIPAIGLYGGFCLPFDKLRPRDGSQE